MTSAGGEGGLNVSKWVLGVILALLATACQISSAERQQQMKEDETAGIYETTPPSMNQFLTENIRNAELEYRSTLDDNVGFLQHNLEEQYRDLTASGGSTQQPQQPTHDMEQGTGDAKHLSEEWGQTTEGINRLREEYGHMTEGWTELEEEYGHTAEGGEQLRGEYGQTTEGREQLKEEYGQTTEGRKQLKEEYGQTTEGRKQLKEEYGQTTERREQMQEEYWQTTEGRKQMKEEYGRTTEGREKYERTTESGKHFSKEYDGHSSVRPNKIFPNIGSTEEGRESFNYRTTWPSQEKMSGVDSPKTFTRSDFMVANDSRISFAGVVPRATARITATTKMTSVEFTSELQSPFTEEFRLLSKKVVDALTPGLLAKFGDNLLSVRVERFWRGSVNAELNITLATNSSSVEEVDTARVEEDVANALKETSESSDLVFDRNAVGVSKVEVSNGTTVAPSADVVTEESQRNRRTTEITERAADKSLEYIQTTEGGKSMGEEYETTTEGSERMKDEYRKTTEGRDQMKEEFGQTTEGRERMKEEYGQTTEGIDQMKEEFGQTTEGKERMKEEFGQTTEGKERMKEEYGQTTEGKERMKEEYGQTTEEREQMREGYEQTTQGKERMKEEFGQTTEGREPMKEEYGQTTEGREQMREEYGQTTIGETKLREEYEEDSDSQQKQSSLNVEATENQLNSKPTTRPIGGAGRPETDDTVEVADGGIIKSTDGAGTTEGIQVASRQPQIQTETEGPNQFNDPNAAMSASKERADSALVTNETPEEDGGSKLSGVQEQLEKEQQDQDGKDSHDSVRKVRASGEEAQEVNETSSTESESSESATASTDSTGSRSSSYSAVPSSSSDSTGSSSTVRLQPTRVETTIGSRASLSTGNSAEYSLQQNVTEVATAQPATTEPPPRATARVSAAAKVTSVEFTPELQVPITEGFRILSEKIIAALTPGLLAKFGDDLLSVRVVRFWRGSVNAELDITLTTNSSSVEEVDTARVEEDVANALMSTSEWSELTFDPDGFAVSGVDVRETTTPAPGVEDTYEFSKVMFSMRAPNALFTEEMNESTSTDFLEVEANLQEGVKAMLIKRYNEDEGWTVNTDLLNVWNDTEQGMWMRFTVAVQPQWRNTTEVITNMGTNYVYFSRLGGYQIDPTSVSDQDLTNYAPDMGMVVMTDEYKRRLRDRLFNGTYVGDYTTERPPLRVVVRVHQRYVMEVAVPAFVGMMFGLGLLLICTTTDGGKEMFYQQL